MTWVSQYPPILTVCLNLISVPFLKTHFKQLQLTQQRPITTPILTFPFSNMPISYQRRSTLSPEEVLIHLPFSINKLFGDIFQNSTYLTLFPLPSVPTSPISFISVLKFPIFPSLSSLFLRMIYLLYIKKIIIIIKM